MQSTNVLVAIKNLYHIKDRTLSLGKNNSRNRVNSVGESLEEFIKDLFCNSLSETQDKHKIHAEFFSYLGAKNSPPDIILKNSDAIEVNKIESLNANIMLYSSHPNDKLYSDSTLIQEDCRNCEDWDVKDFMYAVGVVNGDKLLSLWFVYGDCYFATQQFYKNLTNPPADVLNITTFNVARYCYVKHPSHLVKHVELFNRESLINVLMLKEKYLSLPIEDRDSIEMSEDKGYFVKDCLIHSPNNPAIMLDAKFISYQPIQ